MENSNKGSISYISPKGFGFIKMSGLQKGIFFHASSFKGKPFEELKVDDEVTFSDVQNTDKGLSTSYVTLCLN